MYRFAHILSISFSVFWEHHCKFLFALFFAQAHIYFKHLSWFNDVAQPAIHWSEDSDLEPCGRSHTNCLFSPFVTHVMSQLTQATDPTEKQNHLLVPVVKRPPRPLGFRDDRLYKELNGSWSILLTRWGPDHCWWTGFELLLRAGCVLALLLGGELCSSLGYLSPLGYICCRW